jgi:NTE family protein
MRKPKKIGLVLGGGGARGLAHIGILKVLEKEKIFPDIIVGTSIGSIVGGALASGMKAEELEKKVVSFLKSDLFKSSELKAMGDAESGAEQRVSRRIQTYFKTKIRLAQALFRPGILPIKDMEKFINFFIPDIQIEETAIPFRAMATDLKTGELVIFRKGSLRRSLLASSAVPGALPPVEINGKQCSDGGIICTVPVRSAFKEGADVVIAIAVDKDVSLATELQTAMDIYARSGEIQGFHLKQYDLERADLVISPELGNIHWTDFSQYKRLISLGESAALKKLPEIKKISKTTVQQAFTDRIKRVIERLFAIRPPENE